MIPAEQVAQSFARSFGEPPSALCFAPGRVNLIGEHIDYAGGCVLPMAIEQGVSCAAAPGEPGCIDAVSEQYGSEPQRISLACAKPNDPPYAGLLRALAGEAHLSGARMCFQSDLPTGKGLSSSATFCVSALGAMLALASQPRQMSALELCRACQRAELSGLGVACGLMDQYASVFGKPGHAVLFDTQSITHEYVPLPATGARFLLVDSGQARRLAASAYGERRSELEAALSWIESELGRKSGVRHLAVAEVLGYIQSMPDALGRRIRHAVTEQHRVQLFVRAMCEGNAPRMGGLLHLSHESLSQDYEVSTPEMDLLCESLSNLSCVHGARIIGGGFGGSLLALADGAAGPEIEASLKLFERRTGLTTGLTEARSGVGALIMPQVGAAWTALWEWMDAEQA